MRTDTNVMEDDMNQAELDALITFFESHPKESMEFVKNMPDSIKMAVAYFALPDFKNAVSDICWEAINR